MKFLINHRVGITIAAAVLLSAVGGFFFLHRATNSMLVEYPDSPFEKLPATAPRLIKICEPPFEEDKVAYNAYLAEQRRIANYRKTEGSQSNLTADERQALDAADARKYVRVRQLSEAILRSNGSSIPAMYIRAVVLVCGDVNPAAALQQLRILRHAVEQLGRKNPSDSVARDWYFEGLQLEIVVLSALGRDEEALRCIELIEQTYEPLPWKKTWPLMRLKRFAEAEATIAATERTGRWPLGAKLDRIGLEATLGRRAQASADLRRYVAATPPSDIPWPTVAKVAALNFQFAEAEEADLNATKVEPEYSRGDAHVRLARWLLQEGRFSEAVDALKHARSLRDRRPPEHSEADESTMDGALASLYLDVGRLNDAERMARRAYDHPGRLGSSAGTGNGRQFDVCFQLWSVLECRIAALRETEAAYSGPIVVDAERHSLEVEAWLLQKKIFRLLDDDGLMKTFRPHFFGSPPDGLLEILPRGIAIAAIERARAVEDHPLAAPYFDAYLAEVAWRHGDFEEAVRLARRALDKLPRDAEKLLYCRVRTVAAMAELQLGHTNECLKLLDPVLDAFPNVLRMLGAAVPVKIENDGSKAARQLAAALSRSPRLRPDPAGLRISIHTDNGKLVLEMFRLSNARHLQQAIPIEKSDVHSAVVAAFQQFHERLASPMIALDQTTINGLDGSPVAIRERDNVASVVQQLANVK